MGGGGGNDKGRAAPMMVTSIMTTVRIRSPPPPAPPALLLLLPLCPAGSRPGRRRLFTGGGRGWGQDERQGRTGRCVVGSVDGRP